MIPSDTTFVKEVRHVRPIDPELGEVPLDLIVTDGGFLLHIMKSGDVPRQFIYDTLEKLLLGVQHDTGRYNDYYKHPENYKTIRTIDTPITISDAFWMDSLYRMTPEERKKAARENPERFFKGMWDV